MLVYQKSLRDIKLRIRGCKAAHQKVNNVQRKALLSKKTCYVLVEEFSIDLQTKRLSTR